MPHIREKNALVGYALDGFGIFSPYDAAGKELRTSDLDECHGITSPIEWDGKTVNMYHYVLTRDYPYSPSCFRGTPVKDNFPERPKPPQPDQPSQKRNVVVPVPDVVQPESVPVQEYPPTSMAKKNVANALSAIERALRAILAEFSK